MVSSGLFRHQKSNMPTRDGGFKCCQPFDLRHNVVSGKYVLGAGDAKIVTPSPPHFLTGRFFWIPSTETEGLPTQSHGRNLSIQEKGRMN